MPISNPLPFEREIVELEGQLESMRDRIATGDESLKGDYEKLEKKIAKLREQVYSNLTSYQRVQLSRHFDRPFTLDFIKYIFSDFIELHGDRLFKDDAAIVGGTMAWQRMQW